MIRWHSMSVSDRESKGEEQDILTLRLEKRLRKQLVERAERNDRSVSAEVRIAIRRYLSEAA